MSDSFDLKNLLRYRPPDLLCQKCLALWRSVDNFGTLQTRNTTFACPVCKVLYEAGDLTVWAYLKGMGQEIRFDNPWEHGSDLASLATTFDAWQTDRSEWWFVPPLNILFKALEKAQKVVHFISYGISPMLIGALKMTSMRVPVRGVVSNVAGMALEELKADSNEAPHFSVKFYERSDNPSDWQASPHQKLIVIDGLLAFKGSANLTTDGWRKVAAGQDHIELVTNIDEVVSLHKPTFQPPMGKVQRPR